MAQGNPQNAGEFRQKRLQGSVRLAQLLLNEGWLRLEQGKYEKAKELALLLAESDQKSLMDYIEKCRH